MDTVFKIVVSDKAERDLRNINDHIANFINVQMVAEDQLKRITRAISSLSTFPMRHKLYAPEIYSDLRVFPVDNYLIFYRVNENNKTVIIVRVLYNARDIQLYL